MAYPEQNLLDNRYQILEILGQGGMGKVYKVHDTVSEEIYAVKEMLRIKETVDPLLLSFKNEFRIMNSLQHPDIVKVFNFGIVDEIPYIVMEYIEGKNLTDLQDISIEEVLTIVASIARTLSYLHSRLYVHRDIKPDNLKIMPDGSVKLLDYGLISQLGSMASGKISGTIQYIAPETIVKGYIDESTDLYSLGVIAYELLTGVTPFKGSMNEILQGHLKETPVEPGAINPDIPASLNKTVMKLLEKDKKNRYRNTYEFLTDISHLMSVRPEIETLEQKTSYLYSNQLIGREFEIKAFEKLLLTLKEHGSASMLIGAFSGLGKTRLLNEFKSMAELSEYKTVFINSHQVADKIFGWLGALIDQIVPLSTEEEVQTYGPQVQFISDHLEKRLGKDSVPDDVVTVTNVMKDWIKAVSKRQTVLFFYDDVQWIDQNSLQVINELIQCRLPNISFVLAFRSNEVVHSHPLWRTVNEGISKYLDLAPLTRQQMKGLLENILYPTRISDDFLAHAIASSGGNVYELIEYLRFLVEHQYMTYDRQSWIEPVNMDKVPVPASVDERIKLRIKTLNPDARKLAESASILGDYLSLESLFTISALKEESFYENLDELMKKQVIAKTNGTYEFNHAMIKENLLQTVIGAKKKQLHKLAAEYFIANLGKYGEKIYPLVAYHYKWAGDTSKAIEYYAKAGEIAEKNHSEWDAFHHYKETINLLPKCPNYPDGEQLKQTIFQKVATYSSAAWIDANTSAAWMEHAIKYAKNEEDMGKVFSLMLSYVVSLAISSKYTKARSTIRKLVSTCSVKPDTIEWAILFGAGVCLVDWYQGYQYDCLNHAQKAIDIFEKDLDSLPADVWPAYSWSLFWRDKARAYLGQPIEMKNIRAIHDLMVNGKSDAAIYWHTLTAVGARAAFTGRYCDLLEWKDDAAERSRKMGRIIWFECWISHSYLYAALDKGEFSQIKNHIERVRTSPDPYQVRLASLFQGRWELIQENYNDAIHHLEKFLAQERESMDNSYLEGVIYLAFAFLQTGAMKKAKENINDGLSLSRNGKFRNPMHRMQFYHLLAMYEWKRKKYVEANSNLKKAATLARELDNPLQLGYLYRSLGEMEFEQGNSKKAIDAFTESYTSLQSIDNRFQAGKVLALIDQIDPKTASGIHITDKGDISDSHTKVDKTISITQFDVGKEESKRNDTDDGKTIFEN